MRFRITVKETGRRPDDLRIAADVRRDLWAHSPVEIDPDNPLHGTHRDERGRAYFEFSTRFGEEVERLLREYGYADRVSMEEVREPLGQACQNCGNIAGPVLPPVCPSCGFRDISPCPVCGEPVPRQRYTRIEGDLFRCPHCRNRVRLRFNDPMFLADGEYNPPLVVVEGV
jgi:hypothetical protein